MRDDLLAVLKRDAPKTPREAAFAVAELTEAEDEPLQAIAGLTRAGDCIALLTSRAVVIGGGGVASRYRFEELATALTFRDEGRRVFMPVASERLADLMYTGDDGEDFAQRIRERLAQIRVTNPNAPTWERVDFLNVVRLSEAGLLVAPKESPLQAPAVATVTITGVGAQIRERARQAGELLRWSDVTTTRVEGVDQIQLRPSVGAVMAFGVLGLAARQKHKRAYLTFETTRGDYVIEDGGHLPLELRALLGPYGLRGVDGELAHADVQRSWAYDRLVGRYDDQKLWLDLDERGAEGWEVANVVSLQNSEVLLLLKRPV